MQATLIIVKMPVLYSKRFEFRRGGKPLNKRNVLKYLTFVRGRSQQRPEFKTRRVYIGLGSNLNKPRQQLHRAILQLKQLPDTHFIIASSFYQTKPVGPQDQALGIESVLGCPQTPLWG